MIRVIFNRDESNELIVSDTNYVSWADRQNVIKRSDNYHGVIITETLDLTFIGEAYEYLLDLDNEFDIAAVCTIVIQLFQGKNGWQDDFIGLIDFTTKKENDKSGNQITYSAYSDDFANKILEREKIKIPYDRLETLDDETITAFANEYTEVDVLGMEVLIKSPFDIQETLSINTSPLFPSISTNNQAGLQSIAAQDSSGAGFNFLAPNDAWIEDRAWFIAGNLTGNFSVTFDVSWKTTPGGSQFSRLKIQDYKGSLTPTDLYDSGNLAFSDATTGLASTTISLDYDFTTESRITFNITATANIIDVYLTENTFTTISKLDTTPCNFVPPIQAWERTIESYTGVSNAILSNFLETGIGSNVWLTNGKLLRQYPAGYSQSDENTIAQLTFNLKEDLFDDTNSVFNIGAGVEYSDGKYNLRVEEKDYFYQSDVIVEIGKDEIEEDSFERERELDYYYNSIKAGYDFEKIEEEGAQEDYNTQSEYSTPVVWDNELKILSKTIGSGRAFEETRRKEIDLEETTDYKFDNNNFFLNVYWDGVEWVQRTTQDFAEINGINDITTPINLLITPARNLDRWGWIHSTGYKGYPGKKLKYNNSKITTNLSTRLDSESDLIRENIDININDLAASLFSGNIVRFNAPVSSATFNTLKNNPYKMVKYFDVLKNEDGYGWIRQVSTSPIDKETNWEIIEAKSFSEEGGFRLLQDGAYRLLEDGGRRILED